MVKILFKCAKKKKMPIVYDACLKTNGLFVQLRYNKS